MERIAASSSVEPAAAFSSPAWFRIGPAKTGAEPSTMPASVMLAAATTSSGMASLSGLIFSIIFVAVKDAARQFQAVQRGDGSVLLRMVPRGEPDPAKLDAIRKLCAQYLGDLRLDIDLVEDIPLTAAGKRRFVVVEPPTADARVA